MTVSLDSGPPVRDLPAVSSVTLPTSDGLAEVTVVGDGSELTPVEVARILKVSPSTVRRYEEVGILPKARRLPGSRHRRYKRDDVMAALRRIEAGEFEG